ncbi:MAG: hypothetical protein SynsKO_28850 [Synoicihabitans sp.]
MRLAVFRSFGALAALAVAGANISSAATYAGIVLPFREVVVSSPVETTITEITCKEGDYVKTGDVLAQLYNRIEDLDMQRTKAALEKREFDFKSAQNLFEDQIISEDEAMKNRIELELARLQAEQAQEIFQLRTIKAPINGVVVEKIKEIGEAVTQTEPMFRLVDIDRVFVQIYVLVEEASRLERGEALTVNCPVGNEMETFAGVVDFIDPRVDAASGLVRIKVVLDNPDHRIKPGLRAEVLAPDA